MSDSGKKKLLFIKSPAHKLTSVESFLNKRNFHVYSETDIHEALTKVIDVDPDFIFLAWDHPDSGIMNLPKSIAQASPALVIPYIMNSKKEDMRKLNVCPLSPKLYPPISGPAIERLVLKSSKKAAEEEAHYSENIAKEKAGETAPEAYTEDPAKAKKSGMLHLKSDNNNADTDINLYTPNETSDDEDIQNFQLIRNSSINNRNDLLARSKKLNMSNAAIHELKNSIQQKVKSPLESLLNTLSETENNASTDEDVNTAPVQKNTKKIKSYCMSIYSNSWCGYLIITTRVELDFSTADIVFTEWIKQQFDNLQEIDEYDYFEFKDVDFNIIDQLSQKADYFESLKINGTDLNVSFFPADPSKMMLALNEDQTLIKMVTEDIPPDTALNFSLHLYLPENKKYLLYTQAHKVLSPEQKKRLISNKILLLYTPLKFEKEYKQFLAEKNVKELYENLQKKFASV